jgi:GT2 family glycosyltransferase
MCASQVRLARDGRLDSAGMLMGADGSSKQRGHLGSPERFLRRGEALLPSGSAALYRREMLEEIGLFDESFFLYCEDTDLGLRARWAGWECLYAPQAMVDHLYSHSAGAASPLKAFYVERNRLFLAVKNLPAPMLLIAPFYTLARYFWHVALALGGRGAAARFARDGNHPGRLLGCVVRAHMEMLRSLPSLWRRRREIKRRLTPRQFRRLVRRHSIGPRQVALL